MTEPYRAGRRQRALELARSLLGRPGDERGGGGDQGPGSAPAEEAPARPAPPPGARNLIVIVLDSCRYDSLVAADLASLRRLGPVQRRFSYATWTAPSHFNLLMGLLPHDSPRHVFASEYYKKDFARYAERLGVAGLGFQHMVPRLWLPDHLRNTLGYTTQALVSLPVLNPATPLAVDFDDFELMDRHNDLRAMIPKLRFEEGRPTFALLNVGETHYPYARPDEAESDWPRIHGVNGVFKHLDDHLRAGMGVPTVEAPGFFDPSKLAQLRERQIEVVRYLDGVLDQLFERLPDNTWVVVTADHGELFGEDGFFGHGPIQHDKVMEVPFVEGRLR